MENSECKTRRRPLLPAFTRQANKAQACASKWRICLTSRLCTLMSVTSTRSSFRQVYEVAAAGNGWTVLLCKTKSVVDGVPPPQK
ncbi:uncharacterized protein EKO05_0002334 [Ascochyta rabiei]|uniref:uncharacterized protein n=1 Tax=Didymella rabiei TaxID=5454 RepID=UPI002209573C|nr:uncharacterized protein EKO05_0002334 [Ascochyta rabiei]UPX11743.1 hypothetical protein EKO05_0002334 [Ascochyta rabiei]